MHTTVESYEALIAVMMMMTWDVLSIKRSKSQTLTTLFDSDNLPPFNQGAYDL